MNAETSMSEFEIVSEDKLTANDISFISHANSSISLQTESIRDVSQPNEKKTLWQRILRWGTNITRPSKYFLMEVERTFYSFVFFFCCTLLMVVLQLLSDKLFQLAIIGPLPPSSMPLSDRIFYLLPNLSQYQRICDYLLGTFMFLTILFNVVLRDRKGNLLKYGGLVMLRRVLFIEGFIYFLRGFCFFVTALPNPRSECKLQYPTGFWTNYVIIVVRMLTGQITACTDNIFSGHSSWVIVCLLTFHMYQSRIWVIVLSYILALCIIFFILATHLHYTVDVLVAIIVSCSIYLSYHYLVILSLDDLFFVRKMGLAPHTMAGFSWQERNKMMKGFKTGLIHIIRWCDGIDIRMKFSPSVLVHNPTFIEKSNQSTSIAMDSMEGFLQPSSSSRQPYELEV